MNKLYLSKNLTSLGSIALGAIAITAITTVPARAFTPDVFHAIGWNNGTSQFYDDARAAFDLNAGDFTVTFCNPAQAPDCFVTIEDAQGDYAPIFTPPSPGPGNARPVISDPTVTFQYFRDIADPGDFADAADFVVVDNPLIFTLVGNGGIETTQTLPVGSIIRGEVELDGALEFELAAGEIALDPNDPNSVVPGNGEWFLEIPDQAEFANRSVLEFGITSNQVDSGGYNAEAEFQDHIGVPEPTSILGLFVIGSLGMAVKPKKKS